MDPQSPPPILTKPQDSPQNLPKEYGGPQGQEPTLHGDWTIRGRCSDF